MQKYLIIILISGLYGCASNYPCGEPGNGECLSVTDNYKRSYNSYANSDDLSNSSSSDKDRVERKPIKMQFNKYSQIPADGKPLLSMPKMMRLWLTPYTDSDNIYHDQSYEYIILDKGHWNYNNNTLLSSDDNLKDVSPAQVDISKSCGYGSFGMAKHPPKQFSPSLTNFPAINSLQHQQSPVITTTTVGGGVDRTATINP